MTHDFNILGQEEKIYIDDNLILYIIETLEWIDTFYFLKTREKRKGLNYYGNTYFEGDNIKKLKRNDLFFFFCVALLLERIIWRS